MIAAFLVLHVTGSPEQAATTYLTDWQTRAYGEMDTVTVNAPEGGVAGPLRAAAAQLGMRHIHLVLGQVTQDGGTAQARFTATATIAAGQVWKYQGQLQLVTQSRSWFVSWSPSDIYPGLQAGQRFVLDAVWGPRAQVLAADGTVLSSPRTIAQSPSLQIVTGNVVRATAAQAKSRVPYQAGDPIGQGGVEEAYQQLAGRPTLNIRIEGPAAAVPSPTSPARRHDGPDQHQHARPAGRSAASGRHHHPAVDLVALQPRPGGVLAVIERPGRVRSRAPGRVSARLHLQGGHRLRPQRTGLRPASVVSARLR